jgi:NAD(P)-dependent dehydrogenase (short-subunit alcohol dehydrogenase family)
MNRIDLHDRVAVITGGAQGLGYATALRMLDSGASVMLWDIDSARVEHARAELSGRGNVAAAMVELTDEGSIEAAVQATLERYGQIDILVNNAGRYSFSSLSEMTEDTFDSMLGLNLKAPFFLTRALAAPMLERGRGKVINVTTMVSHFGHPAAAVYGASKAALGLLTKAWAVELGPSGVNVNAICPGAIRTPGTEFMGPALDEFGSTLPAGFVGAPSDVANAAVYLASDEADYIHGAMIAVDGGRLAA